MSISSTIQVPYEYSTTLPPLQEGEVVYKIIGPIEKKLIRNYYDAWGTDKRAVYDYLFPKKKQNTPVERKSDGMLLSISTAFLGYVRSTGVGGGQERYLGTPVYSGYEIMWEQNHHQYINFEDENAVVGLKNINILGPEELWTKIMK